MGGKFGDEGVVGGGKFVSPMCIQQGL